MYSGFKVISFSRHGIINGLWQRRFFADQYPTGHHHYLADIMLT
jgi:hypothetical protein